MPIPETIVRNGGTARVYASLVDGSRMSMCVKYPITKRVYAWQDEQIQAAIVAERERLSCPI